MRNNSHQPKWRRSPDFDETFPPYFKPKNHHRLYLWREKTTVNKFFGSVSANDGHVATNDNWKTRRCGCRKGCCHLWKPPHVHAAPPSSLLSHLAPLIACRAVTEPARGLCLLSSRRSRDTDADKWGAVRFERGWVDFGILFLCWLLRLGAEVSDFVDF